MPITSDEEASAAVEKAGRLLQQVQDYLGGTNTATGKVRFPRGFIRTASHFRNRLLFITEDHTRDNLAYALILLDV